MNKFNGRIDKKQRQFRITDRKLFDEWVRTESEQDKDFLYELKISSCLLYTSDAADDTR